MRHNNPNSGKIVPKLEMLHEDECSLGKGLSSEKRRTHFRGPTLLGGSHQISSMQGNSRARPQNQQARRKMGPKTTFMALEDKERSPNRRSARSDAAQPQRALVRKVSGGVEQRRQDFSNSNRTHLGPHNINPALSTSNNQDKERMIRRYNFGDWCKSSRDPLYRNSADKSRSAARVVPPVAHLVTSRLNTGSTKTRSLGSLSEQISSMQDSMRCLFRMCSISWEIQIGSV